MILTPPTVTTWVGRNLTDTSITTNITFKACMDALPQSSYYPDSVSYPNRVQSVALQNGYAITSQYMLECRACFMTPDNQWAVLQLPFPSSDESYFDNHPFRQRIGDIIVVSPGP